MNDACRRALAVALFAAAATGCASDGARKPEGDARVVALGELPESHRAVWAAWQKGDAPFELERKRVESDPALARFVVDNLVREMVRTYERSSLSRPGGDPGRFERAQADLVALAPWSASVLAELLRVPDGVIAFLAGDRLIAIGAPAVAHVVAILEDERLETRRRAAELLGKLPHAGAGEIAVQQALAARVERDPDWPVRAEAARALGLRGSRHDHKGYAAGVLVRALRDPDTTAATSAAKGLASLGERSAIPRMVGALEHAAGAGQVALVRAIEEALGVLVGDARSRTLAEWKAFARG